MGRQSRSKGPKKPRQVPAAEPIVPAPAPVPGNWYWLVSVLIVAAMIGLYWNIQGNEFLTFDDRKYIYENELVTGDGGLAAIWGDLWNEKPKLHYRPVTFSIFWIEHALVGLRPPNTEDREFVNIPAHPLYHWTQVLFHAATAILILFVLRALRAPFLAAAFAAVCFAVHPVNVASVAWMAELKNVVSGLLFWLALLFYVLSRRRSDEPAGRAGAPWLYAAAVAVFALALLAKVAAVVLAPILIVTDRLLDRRWSWGAVLRSAPFFALGLLAAQLTAIREASIAKSWEPIDMLLRPFIAVAALVHYVVKMFVPIKQAIIYPRWAESLSEPRYWISLVVVIVATILIWRYRAWLGDLWLWALALFLLSVAPVLGIKYFIWMQFAFVSDHYMYYGAPGVLLLAGLLLARWCARESAEADGARHHGGRLAVVSVVCLLALAGCGVRTVQQNRTWKNNVTLWTHTLRLSPDCVVCNLNMGNHYARTGDHERALQHYKEFARVRPDYIRAWTACARQARQLGLTDEVITYYQQAIAAAEAKDRPTNRIQLEYADYLQTIGLFRQALAQYEAALAKRPPNAAAIDRVIEQIRRRLAAPAPATPAEP